MADKHNTHERLEELRDALLYAPLGLLYEYEEVVPRLVRRGKSQVQLAKMIGKVATNRIQVEQNLSDAADGVSNLMARGLLEIGNLFGLAPDTSIKYPMNEAAPVAGARSTVAGRSVVPQAAAQPAGLKPSKARASKSIKAVSKKSKPGKSKSKVEKSKVEKSDISSPKKTKPKEDKLGTAPPVAEPAPSSPIAGAAKSTGLLPIAGYERLTAKALLPLLTDLTASERTQVRMYELKNRSRKTVLAKLDRLDD